MAGELLAIVIAVPLAAVTLYAALGDPASLTRTAHDRSPAALAQHVRSQPQDARGWILLGRGLAAQDRFSEGAAAYARATALPNAARDPGVWAEYADTLGMAQGGSLQGEPAALIERALQLDPNHRQALELAGSAAYERGDYAGAATHWRALLAQLPPASAPAHELASAIERSERLARTNLR